MGKTRGRLVERRTMTEDHGLLNDMNFHCRREGQLHDTLLGVGRDGYRRSSQRKHIVCQVCRIHRRLQFGIVIVRHKRMDESGCWIRNKSTISEGSQDNLEK